MSCHYGNREILTLLSSYELKRELREAATEMEELNMMKVELKKMKTENGNRKYGIKTEMLGYEEEINWMKVEQKEIKTENMD